MSHDFIYSILFRLRDFWQKITRPTSRREDDARREYILSVLLVFLSALSIIFTISVVSLAIMLGTLRQGISIWTSISLSAFFLGLLCISKKGWWKLSTYIFLGLLIIPTLYSLARWGTLLPIPLLTLSLIIVLTGILINTKTAIIMAIGLGSYLGALNHAHQNSLLSVDKNWMHNELYANYSVEVTILLLVISGIIWLAYREIENSLRRARRSEALVKKEKDTLEERVIARTKELEKTQMERIKEIARLGEIGKLSAGLMHDLINPLTAVTIQIDELSKSQAVEITEIHEHVQRALAATNRLTALIDRIRRELSNRAEPQLIEVSGFIQQIIEAVQYNANQLDVAIEYTVTTQFEIMSNPLRLYRGLVNIITNAIEACTENPNTRPRKVTVEFGATDQDYVLSISDTGCGIEANLLPHIFEPFFSTKSERGIGLGLHIAQELLYQELGAKIIVSSEVNQGTTFIISWPRP